MPSFKAADFNEDRKSLDHCSAYRNGCDDNCCARASCCDYAFLFGIQIDHSLPVDKRRIQQIGTHKSRLLVNGENAFKRRMCDCIVIKNSKHVGNCDPVISSEGCSDSCNIVIFDGKCNRISLKIMRHARSCGTNHVHVSLQYDDIGFLIPFRTGFFHDHIALFIGNSIKIMVNCELDKVFCHSLCIA